MLPFGIDSNYIVSPCIIHKTKVLDNVLKPMAANNTSNVFVSSKIIPVPIHRIYIVYTNVFISLSVVVKFLPHRRAHILLLVVNRTKCNDFVKCYMFSNMLCIP